MTGKASHMTASFKRRKSTTDVVFDVILYILCCIILIVVAYPIYFVVLASFSKPSDDANRFSGNAGIPFMYNTNGYGVLLNSGWASRFALGRAENLPGNEKVVKPAAPWALLEPDPECDPERWAIVTEGGDVDLFIMTGAEPLDILRGYYQLTGFPPMLPKWALG